MKWRARLPPLVPRRMVAVGADGEVRGLRIRLRWNGAFRVVPAPLPQGAACVAVFAHVLPFRRKLQQLPPSAKAREALLRAAPGEFPMAAENMRYALGIQAGEGYLYALPAAAIDALRERGLRPAIALVADGEPDPRGCLETLEHYQRHGPTLDLLRERRFVSRRRLLQAQLGAVLVLGLFALAALFTLPDPLADYLERRMQGLREQAGPLPVLYRATEKMAQTQTQAARLYASPEARLPGVLARLFAGVPPGHSLRSIELQNGVLRIAGDGVKVREWLVAEGFAADRIVVETVGSFQRFHADRPL